MEEKLWHINFTKGKKMTVTYSGGQYVWKETNEILTGGFYVHLDEWN